MLRYLAALPFQGGELAIRAIQGKRKGGDTCLVSPPFCAMLFLTLQSYSTLQVQLFADQADLIWPTAGIAHGKRNNEFGLVPA